MAGTKAAEQEKRRSRLGEVQAVGTVSLAIEAPPVRTRWLKIEWCLALRVRLNQTSMRTAAMPIV